jgi:hypothetical protein
LSFPPGTQKLAHVHQHIPFPSKAPAFLAGFDRILSRNPFCPVVV